jgi:hypothetical protein
MMPKTIDIPYMMTNIYLQSFKKRFHQAELTLSSGNEIVDAETDR